MPQNKAFKSKSNILPICVGVVSIALGGCSSEATRFSDSPFSNPFKTSGSSSAPSTAKARTAPNTQTPSRGGYGVEPVTTNSISSSYNKPTSSISSNPTTTGVGQWSVANGTIVSAQDGDNLDKLSYRYGVPASAIAQANGLKSGSSISSGQKLVIPVLNSSNAQQNTVHAVQESTPITHQARTIAEPTAEQKATVEPKMAKSIPQPERIQRASETVEKKQNQIKTTTAKVEPIAPTKTAVKQDTKTDQKVVAQKTTKPVVEEPKQVASINTQEEDTKEAASFRWPVKGRVISSFGSKGAGNANDGINISVPEGTSVRAAEDGQVVYAGSELKGYGNLVLVRHDNGFVSAYAHNSKINVKKGDKVTRGQTVAQSGNSGDVTSPQLHFELRKGSTPVNPLTYLP